MADKPKTYPMQIQELKERLQEKDEIIVNLQMQLQLIPDLEHELAAAREQVANSGNSDVKAFALNQAKMTDLQQAADSNARLARQYKEQRDILGGEVDKVQSQLDLL